MTETPYVPSIDYTSRDFASLLDDMTAQIPVVLPEWTTRNPGDPAMALLELFAYSGDILNFYLDKVASENFLNTAVQRDSLLAIAEAYGYVPSAVSPATVTLLFNNAVATPAVIPARTQVTTQVDLSGRTLTVRFETDSQITVPASGSATVTATQGRTYVGEVLGISNGTADQRFTLYNSPVVRSSVQVTVNESGADVGWTNVTSALDYSGTDRVFTVEEDSNGISSVVFGDGVSGRVPVQGGVVKAQYRVSDGALGNVGASTLSYIASSVPGGVSVTNPAAATGGGDPESTERLRENIPASLRTLNRAVTIKDYGALAVTQPGVALANARSSVYTNVQVAIAPEGGGLPTTALKTSVQGFLQDRCPAGTTVTVIDPTYVPVNLTLEVAVRPAYRQATVEVDVRRLLQALFSPANVQFGDLLTLGDIAGLLQSVPGVNFVTVSVLAKSPTTTGVSNIQCSPVEILSQGTTTLTFTGGMA